MRAKQVSITLEQGLVMKTIQHFDVPGRMLEGPQSEEVIDRREYRVISMRNACVLEVGCNGIGSVRVGDVLTEEQANVLAGIKCYDVTIKA
jgi:hypothetical protein